MKDAKQALAALMRLCARAEKSSGDAMRLMRTWEVPAADRAGVLTTLLEQKFIDDTRYSAAYVSEKSRLAGWGEFKIRRALAAKGVSREIINAALQENLSGSRLDEKLAAKLRTLRAQRSFADAQDDALRQLRAKLFRYGVSLGYSFDDVNEALEKTSLRGA